MFVFKCRNIQMLYFRFVKLTNIRDIVVDFNSLGIFGIVEFHFHKLETFEGNRFSL